MKQIRILGCIIALMGIFCMIPNRPSATQAGIRAEVTKQVGDNLFEVEIGQNSQKKITLDLGGGYEAGDEATLIITKDITPTQSVLVSPRVNVYTVGCMMLALGMLLNILADTARREICIENPHDEDFPDEEDKDEEEEEVQE